MSSRRKGRHHYLAPRTSTYPMKLERYLEIEQRSRVVDDDRLTVEWKEWYDRVSAKHRESN